MTEVRKVLAPNPGIYTGPGTNTYILVAGGRAAVIDPGPVIADHADAIVAGIGADEPAAVLVTHTHPDHAPLANPLGQRLGVPVIGYAPGPDFSPDLTLGDGELFSADGLELVAVHTPGHAPDHLCYLVGSVLFTGDHIMGGSTVVIDDAAAYMDSLQRVLELEPSHLYPGHGPEIGDAREAVEEYIEHRNMRESQILGAVAGGAETVPDLVVAVYEDLDPALRAAAARQVAVHLEKLVSEGRLTLTRGDEGKSELIRLAEEMK